MDTDIHTVMEKLIDTGFEYLKDRRQKGMKEELERLQENHPMIQAVVAYASTRAHIRDQNFALDRWLWQLRDAIDEADDLLDDFEYIKHEEQLMTRNMEETKVRCIICHLFECALKIGKRAVKFGLRALNFDPNLKRLEEVVHKFDKVSAEVSTFLPLLESPKQEQQRELYTTRLTVYSSKNDIFVLGKEKDIVLEWLTKPSNDLVGSTWQRNISLLSIVGHGGMGKTTLLQHVYEDQITIEFDLKMWIYVSDNFDVKRVIVDMLVYLEKERPRLGRESPLGTLQESLRSAVMSKKFLLVLDDIWEEQNEELNRSKWEHVLAPLASGKLGSKILVTTRSELATFIIAKVMKIKYVETFKLEGLDKDECLQLLYAYAFAGEENSNVHDKLRSIAEKMVKKLLGSPLAAKAMGMVLRYGLYDRPWIDVLNGAESFAESSFAESFQDKYVMDVFRMSYIVLPKHLQSCFTFCCMFPKDHHFDKDDLVRMWIALGFVRSSYNQGDTLVDIGGRYFDVLVNKSFFDKLDSEAYKMNDLLYSSLQSVSARECFRVECDEESRFQIHENIRHLSVQTNNLKVLENIRKFKNLRSLFLTYKGDQALVYENNQDLVEVLAKIFEAVRNIRILYIYAEGLKIIPEEIGHLKHLRYLKFHQINVVQMPKSLSKLYHLQSLIYDTDFWYVSRDILPSNKISDGLIFDSY